MFLCSESVSSIELASPELTSSMQHAHADAAIGRLQQALREQPSGRIVVEDVVLQVDRMLRLVRERHTAHERVVALGQQAESRKTRVRAELALDVVRRRRIGRRRQ